MSHARVLLATRPTLRRSQYEGELRQHGFEVVTADDGIACLEVLKSISPDVIVIESDLPWGGGDGVLDVISVQPSLCNIPVMVLISDFNWTGTYQIARYRIDDFAVQPLPPERLVSRVTYLAFGDLVAQSHNEQ